VPAFNIGFVIFRSLPTGAALAVRSTEPLWRVLEGVFSKRDHEFESAFLQRRVHANQLRLWGHQAARDVGQALAKNPVALIILCHRLLAAGAELAVFRRPQAARQAHAGAGSLAIRWRGTLVGHLSEEA
jgi:hypothetical protein